MVEPPLELEVPELEPEPELDESELDVSEPEPELESVDVPMVVDVEVAPELLVPSPAELLISPEPSSPPSSLPHAVIRETQNNKELEISRSFGME